MMKTPIWQQKQAQEVDRKSIQDHNIPGLTLMESAGKAVATYIQRLRAPDRPLDKISATKLGDGVIVLAGNGNNGGDALVTARLLLEAGYQVDVFLVGDPEKGASPDCQKQKDQLPPDKLNIYKKGCLNRFQKRKNIVIDGILGLGQKGKIRPGLLFDALNEAEDLAHKLVIAIDVPSGLQVDLWQQEPPPLASDICITFGGGKLCHSFNPSRQYCGRVEVVDIGFHPEAIDSATKTTSVQFSWDYPYLKSLQPWQDLAMDSHKFQRGHVLIIGGSEGKLGAPLLAASAAQHCGAGWVSVALPRPVAYLDDVPLEVTFEDFFKDGIIEWPKVMAFVKNRKVKAVCIGPGTMVNPIDKGGVPYLLELAELGVFLVVDGGALDGLGVLLDQDPIKKGSCLLTPHPGEWRKLHPQNTSLDDAKAILGGREQAARWGTHIFYKTSTPFTISPHSREVLVSQAGNSSLAKAGSGDVLAGAATILGTRVPADEVGNLCQYYLAETARIMIKKKGYHGVVASDIARYLGVVIPE